MDLVEDVSDPLIRSSFWQALAAGQVVAGRYRAALQTAARALAEIDRSHVEFARPHIQALAATAHIGLGSFGSAESLLSNVHHRATKGNDKYLCALVETLRLRIALYDGKTHAASQSFSTVWSESVLPSLRAEFLAMQAAAFACLGETDRALELSSRAEKLSSWLETKLLGHWVRALCAIATESATSAEDLVHLAYDATVSSGGFDALVFAQRVQPAVLAKLAADPSLHEQLAVVLTQANDEERARAHGISVQQLNSADTGSLTPREVEVYFLLGEGKSNREIARALVISEPTAKVHVQHILKKLGARSRTEVAVRAATTRRLRGRVEAEGSVDRQGSGRQA